MPRPPRLPHPDGARPERSRRRPAAAASDPPSIGEAGPGDATPPDDARRAHTAQALDALRRVVRALRVAAGSAESVTGLSAAQLFVLQQVAAQPGQWLTALAARTLTDRTSVAAAVEGLAARDLVRREPSAVDRRRVEIHPTDAGRALLAHAPHPPTRRVLDGMDALDDADLGELAGALTRLADAMGLHDAPAPMLFDDERPRG